MITTCVALVAACAGDGAVGCSSEPPLFSSPTATIQSLFRAYGVEDLTQDDVRARLRAQQHFELVDEPLYRACFTEWRGDHDESLGGYVLGRLIVRKDHLLVKQVGDTATVTTEGEAPGTGAVILRKVGDRWKIDLMASIPNDVRSNLGVVDRGAERRQGGAR